MAHLELLRSGAPGQTCLRVVAGGVEQARRCTWGHVWDSSLRRTPGALTAAVQLAPGWTELWIFHRAGHRWKSDVVPPDAAGPGLGTAEAAGATPDGTRLLIVRASMARGRLSRRYQLAATRSLRVLAQSSQPAAWFNRLSPPSWRGSTLALQSSTQWIN